MNCRTICHSGITISHPHQQSMSDPVSLCPPHHMMFWFVYFNANHLSGSHVVFHCGLDLHFPNDQWCWIFFHVLSGHLYIFEEMPIQLLNPFFFFFELSFCCWVVRILYMFRIPTPSPNIWFANFANLFSQSVSLFLSRSLLIFIVLQLGNN